MVTIFKNITSTTEPHYIEPIKLLHRIRDGKSKFLCEEIRQSSDKELRNKRKAQLPSVCWAGKFTRRSNDACIEQSKLLILDFDNIENPKELKKELSLKPYCYSAWISPSGTGVKMLVKVSTANHLGHFLALSKELNGVDQSGKDLARVCYESYDPDIFINEDSQPYTTTLEQTKPKTEKRENAPTEIYEKLKTWILKQGIHFVEGNRNTFITKLAAACNRTGIHRDEARFLIYSDFVAKESGFSDSELDATLDGVYSRYTKDHGSYAFKNDKLTDIQGRELTKENFDDGLPPKDIIFCSDVKEDMKSDLVNGLQKGNTTYFPEIDKHFTWLKGQLNVLNGFGNYGKSTFHTQLQLIRSVKAGEKWCVFSPEQSPAKFYFRDLIQQHTGKTFSKGTGHDTITVKEMEDSADFINEHFFLVEPVNDSPTPEYMMERFFETIIKKGVDGCVIDPFNQLSNHWEKFSGKDTYLEKYLNTFKQFAKQNNIYFTIIAHPKTPGRDMKNEAPDVFDLAGGAMWNNKADNILCYHRPNHHVDKTDPSCVIISQKIRFQQIVGIPGQVEMTYDRSNFKFMVNGFNPLLGNTKPKMEPQRNFFEPNKDFDFINDTEPF